MIIKMLAKYSENVKKSSDKFHVTMIHYLKNKVGVVDFANAQGVVIFKAQGLEGPAGFETLPISGLL